MYITLTDYNYHNNTPLSNTNIREAICKLMEEESITDSNNFTADTFSCESIVQRENANAIVTSYKIDKLDELVDAVKNLTIKDAEYYESNTAIASDSKGVILNPETVNHTINRNFEHKLLIK